MANFDLSALAHTSGNAASNLLRPYSITNVEFTEASLEQIEAKHGENAGKLFDVVKVKFTAPEGSYEETLFLPARETEDRERVSNSWGGQQPSAFDRFQMFVGHVGKNINPEGLVKFQEALAKGDLKIDGDFQSVCKKVAQVFVELLNKKKGHKVALKLVGRSANGTIRATLPYYTAISKAGEAYISNQFISDLEVANPITLSFKANELKKKAELENIKPTDMTVENPLSTLDTPANDIATIGASTPTPSEDNSDLLNLLNL